MKFYPESEFRDKADMPTIEMLNLWHEECCKRLKSDVPVQIADRKENPRFKDFDSPFSTATPQELENKLCLVLWLESIEPLEHLLITHELGHLYHLGHCLNPKCVMHFSTSLVNIDIKGKTFCSKCQQELKENIAGDLSLRPPSS